MWNTWLWGALMNAEKKTGHCPSRVGWKTCSSHKQVFLRCTAFRGKRNQGAGMVNQGQRAVTEASEKVAFSGIQKVGSS